MYTCILWDNTGNPYTYGPFDTMKEATNFGVAHYGYRFHVAQHIDFTPDEWDKQRDAYLSQFP